MQDGSQRCSHSSSPRHPSLSLPIPGNDFGVLPRCALAKDAMCRHGGASDTEFAVAFLKWPSYNPSHPAMRSIAYYTAHQNSGKVW